jgi:hypothetical protein
MNIVEAHMAVESLLDQYQLPLVSRLMMDSFLRIGIHKTVSEVLDDYPGEKGKLIKSPELTMMVKQQLKEYVLPKTLQIAPAAGLYFSKEIIHTFRYIFDVITTVAPGSQVYATPVDYSQMILKEDDPFDKPTLVYPKKLYVSLIGSTMWVMKPTDAMITGVSYNCLVNPDIDSGHEVRSGENGKVSAEAIVWTETCTYNNVVYERGEVITNFDSSKLTIGSVVYQYANLVIPEHIYPKVITESALLVDNFFGKKSKNE